jgi:hypothetical protein
MKAILITYTKQSEKNNFTFTDHKLQAITIIRLKIMFLIDPKNYPKII